MLILGAFRMVSVFRHFGPGAPPMSWDSYVQNMVASKVITEAAILGLDGSTWCAFFVFLQLCANTPALLLFLPPMQGQERNVGSDCRREPPLAGRV